MALRAIFSTETRSRFSRSPGAGARDRMASFRVSASLEIRPKIAPNALTFFIGMIIYQYRNTRGADMITAEKAKQNGTKVYQTLLRQGRPEADARRDAEQWVMGNYGVDVTLEAPSGLASDIEDILNRAARNTVRTETQAPQLQPA